MLPIVASIVSNLISNGLPKVADAVMDKGVEAVEAKLGMKLKTNTLANGKGIRHDIENLRVRHQQKRSAVCAKVLRFSK